MRYTTRIAALTLTIITMHVSAQQKISFRQLYKSDSLAKVISWVDKEFTTKEKNCHLLIWNLREIRELAVDLKKKGVDAFTMTDEWPSPESEYYVVGFYEMQLFNNVMNHYARLTTYRINKKMKLEMYHPEDDSWSSVAMIAARKN